MKKLKYLLTLALLCVVPTTTQAYELTYPVAKAYGEVLQNVVEEYGGSTGRNGGLAYCELLDFDGNGTLELYLYYIQEKSSEFPYNPALSLTEEVWTLVENVSKKVFTYETEGFLTSDYLPMAFSYGSEERLLLFDQDEIYLNTKNVGGKGHDLIMNEYWFGYENNTMKPKETFEFNSYDDYLSGDVDNQTFIVSINENGVVTEKKGDWIDPEDYLKKLYSRYHIEEKRSLYTIFSGVLEWETNLTLLDTLSKYNFSFPYPETTLDDSRISVDFSEIYISYTLGEGIFLVVGEENGEMKSGIYYHSIIDGNQETQHLYSESGVIEASKVQQILVQFQNNSNILMDYSPLHTFTKPEEFSEHLNKILQNIAGTEVNAYGKQEIVQYITLCLAQMGVTNSSIYENTYVVHGDVLKNSVLRISHMMELFQKVLDNNKITLSNVPEQKVQLILHGYDGTTPLQITLDSSVLDVLFPDIALEIIISGSTYVFGFSFDTLKSFLETGDSFTFTLEQKEESTYQLTFFDKLSTEIPRTTANISLTLPASSPLDTVFVTYFGGVDNWGGQFDENQKTISFLTSYTGEYQITEQILELTDLDGISESQRKSIEFMVSKGFFHVDDGYFNPNQPLTRYEFAQALVGMFFALDRSLTTAFEDVPEDSHFYPFVASAHQRNLVAGFTEIRYGGDENVTEEQVLTIIGRALSEEKGYSFPENPEDYLDFSGGLDTSDWAKPNVALCYRDGLIQVGEEIFPQTDISKAKATEYLYRLFMLLYEVNPVTVTVPELTVESKKDDTFALTVGVALGWSGVIGTGVYLSNQSKNKKKKESV